MNPNHDANEPTSKSITYQEVCQGKSGYVEVLLLELHDPQTHFEDVIRFFFGIHDPTTINLQGADRGTQYSSVIFCADECQKAIVRKVMEELEHFLSCSGGIIHCYERKVVQTKVVDLTPFTEATERHQEYLSKNPKGYWYVVCVFLSITHCSRSTPTSLMAFSP
jgi:peptide-methionine (S)-S-oxide reductase